MIFEFAPSGNKRFMETFAKSIGSKIEKGSIVLPKKLGTGQIKLFDLDPMIKMMALQFELKEELIFRRISDSANKDKVTMTFHNVFQHRQDPKKIVANSSNTALLPSVQVTSTHLDFESVFPAGQSINTIIVAIHVDLLKNLLNLKEENALFSTIISGKQPYVYEEIISPKIQEAATTIIDTSAPKELHNFYFKLKAQELIYYLLVELLKREQSTNQALNIADVKALYLIKEKILSDLSTPPVLSELALTTGMSESKLKRLFKQIFGNSIYNYFQHFRMNEAVYLLKEEKISVSEVGYRLGFTNLSHFTRIFEKHIGVKPKKYSMTQS